ncbi:MAG: hypothetical protein IPN29_07470 [Saprospiraceae bacterium]|nr:hypothetical protein [Saprospiraceae bacterium]
MEENGVGITMKGGGKSMKWAGHDQKLYPLKPSQLGKEKEKTPIKMGNED